MAPFEYTLPAVRGVQSGREYFITMCPLQLVPRLFQFEEGLLTPELRAQRVLNEARVPEIATYLARHPKSYVLSSLTGAIDGTVRFQPLAENAGPATPGYLKVSMSARMVIHDGLHRCAAIAAAVKKRPELAEETVSVVLYVDPGLRHAEQMFTDLKRNEIRTARSQRVLYDHRDENARLVKALITRVPAFEGMTETMRSKISNRSLKLFTLSAIYHATRTLLSDRGEELYSVRLQTATDFWSEVAKQIPDWGRAKAGEVSPGELRKNYVHSHAIALAALGEAGRGLIRAYRSSWRRKLRALCGLDWARSNTQLWEGRAMIAGRLSKARTCVLLTSNALKARLGLPLSAEEQALEERLRSRG